MPFDGVVVKCIVNELSDLIISGRIEKIFQPEPDEILMNIRAKGQNLKLLLSASPSYPRIHLTNTSKDNPATPPVFCMLLRKHLSGGKIIDVQFHDFERIVSILVESINELGDTTIKKLVIEIMGRHSNIMLLNSEDKIHDSIKHVDSDISRVREVMPGRPYTFPPSQDKINPEQLDVEKFIATAVEIQETVEKYLLNTIKGFSPILCREICHISGIHEKASLSSLDLQDLGRLESTLKDMVLKIEDSDFSPCVAFENDASEKPLDFHCITIHQYRFIKSAPSMSEALELYYYEKDKSERLKQKKSDIVKVLGNNIDRCHKKLALQQEKLRDVSDREKLKLYGELITANIYCIEKNIKSVSLLNYYSENNETIDIPLNENLTPQENAQKYFRQYSKAKSTYNATRIQVEETLKELDYLEGVLQLLENCNTLLEIDEVRQELTHEGYISSRKKSLSNKKNKPSMPLHFKSSDGIDIFVGKNNMQNDQLTLKMAASSDIWLHTQKIHGSHVIIKNHHKNIPDNTLLEAAILSAFHSKAKMSSNVPVDYTPVKNVKKPHGAKPGMVIYENFKTIIVTPDEKLVRKLKIE